MDLFIEEVLPNLKQNSEGELNQDSVIMISAYVLAKTLVGDFQGSFYKNLEIAKELIEKSKN